MRYKAYLNKIDIAHWKPGDTIDNYELVDEDDDLQILQSKIRDKGIEYVKRIKMVDTYYEDKFNKKQKEVQEELKSYVLESLNDIIADFITKNKNRPITNELKAECKIIISKKLSQHCSNIFGTEVSDNDIYISISNNFDIDISIPAYNIEKITFNNRI